MLALTVFGISASALLTIVPLVLSYNLHKRKSIKLEKDEQAGFRALFCLRKSCEVKEAYEFFGVHSYMTCDPKILETLLQFIFSARESIDFCINHFTLTEIKAALIRLHKMDIIKVRLIMDREMCKPLYRSAYTKLKESGIPIKVQTNENGIMHHKFMLVDKQKVMFGSLNFTHQALTENYETMLTTNDKFIVKRFVDTFEELWNTF